MTTAAESRALGRARARSRKLYPRSKALQNTYVRGAWAAIGGRPRSVCPYRDDGRKTWARSWYLAWTRGFDSVPPADEP